MRIALFSTCIGDALFPDVQKATALVLSRLGHEVVFPEEQTCCGPVSYTHLTLPTIYSV